MAVTSRLSVPALRRLLPSMAACVLTGCASEGWLDRSIVADLPLDAPTSMYPTALSGPIPPRPAAYAAPATSRSDGPSTRTEPPQLAEEKSSTDVVAGTRLPSTYGRQPASPLVPTLAVLPPAYAPQPAAPSASPSPVGTSADDASHVGDGTVAPASASEPPAIATYAGQNTSSQVAFSGNSDFAATSSVAAASAAAFSARASNELAGKAVGSERPAESTPPSIATGAVGDSSVAVPANTLASSTASPRTAPDSKPASSNPQPTSSESSASESSTTTTKAEAASPPASPAERQAHIDRAWRDLIEALEEDLRQRRAASPPDDELPRREQQLRLAYLVAGKLDEAVTAVESLPASQREAYKHLMFGLGVWLSPDESRRMPLRGAKVLRSLREATRELAASSKLEIKNLVFCERVDYYGWYTEFPRYEFQPRQQVILYVEIENFAAEYKPPAGYETELHGSYEILDASGQIVASRQLPPDKEVCRNYRRDYFLAYRIYLPDNIAPGRYRLELTIEDLKARTAYQGRKLGEGTIEFSIR